MKFMLLILSFIVGLFSTNAQSKKTTPPGTVKINDTLFADKTEVANVHWREFTDAYILQLLKDTSFYNKMLADTSVWECGSPEEQYYLRHPSFNYYPVVGISYEQALEYCKWRTYAANLNIYWKENNIINPKLDSVYNFPFKFYYRLPSPEEFDFLLKPGIDSSKKLFKKWSKRDSIWNNTKENFDRRQDMLHNNFANGAVPVQSYFTNKLGLFNIIGNVAEMTSEKGVAKGGSFIHPLSNCISPYSQLYSNPENWLGFRCIAVMIQ